MKAKHWAQTGMRPSHAFKQTGQIKGHSTDEVLVGKRCFALEEFDMLTGSVKPALGSLVKQQDELRAS